MRDQVPVLRHERPQDWHKLRRANVVHLHDLRDDVVRTLSAIRADRTGVLPCGRIRDDLYDVAARYCGKLVYFKNGQERFVKCFG